MRIWLAWGVMALASAIIVEATANAAGQTRGPSKTEAQLRSLFPAAATFSPKEGNPPHYSAFAPEAEGKALLGIAFLTTELEPLERGYDGPIKMLVGLTPKGTLAGVVVVEHREPYGYFSVDPPAFAAQFVGKDIRDRFRVGEDVAAVSRASITMTSAARAIRNSARRAARQLLTPPQ